MNIYSIYKATNKINGKVYIGHDSHWPNRMSVHKCNVFKSKKDFYFYRALRKYGFNNFEWEVIYQSKDVEHCLRYMETYFIKEYNAYINFENCNGYNMTLGGEGTIGYKHTEETKAKLRVPQSESHRNKLAKIRKGRILSSEWKENIGKAFRGEKHPLYGIKRPKEWNDKASYTSKNLPKFQCEHCGKKSNPGNHARWHGDRCKMVNNQKVLAIVL
jgi:group I intron endonuclease